VEKEKKRANISDISQVVSYDLKNEALASLYEETLVHISTISPKT
jgi:hypothetical protein